MIIKRLIDNDMNDDKLISEHGYSVYVEHDNKKILFDTGQTGAFIDNAKILNVDLENIDILVLSHGHYDHSGGVKEVLPLLKSNVKIYTGQEFFKKKYKLLPDGDYKYNGNPFDIDLFETQEYIPVSEDITFISENIILFKNFKMSSQYEKLNPNFRIKENGSYVQDDFADEIVLGLLEDNELKLIVGCSHRGIVNILNSVKNAVNMPIKALYGGIHLVDANEERIDATKKELKDINELHLSHCTGIQI